MLKESTFAFVTELPNGQFRVYKLGQVIPAHPNSSNSVILTLAAYITWKFPNLSHPNYPNFIIKGLDSSSSTECQFEGVHPLFEAWSDLLCSSIFQRNSVRVGSVLYVLISVNNSYISELQKYNWSCQIFIKKVSVREIFNLEQVSSSNKNILFFNLAISQLRANQLLPKINLPALLLGTIFNNQNWLYYQILKGKYPQYDELLKADVIILPGSSHSVSDNVPEIEFLIEQIQKSFIQNRNLKILGICFGHQILSKIFGAEIVRKVRCKGFEKVKFDEKVVSNYPFLKSIKENIQKQFIMLEYHEDFVETLPEGFDLIAKSNTCKIESMVKKDGRALSFQFHPQYSYLYSRSFTKRVLFQKVDYHMNFSMEIEKQHEKIHQQSCERIRLCMKQFLAS